MSRLVEAFAHSVIYFICLFFLHNFKLVLLEAAEMFRNTRTFGGNDANDDV